MASELEEKTKEKTNVLKYSLTCMQGCLVEDDLNVGWHSTRDVGAALKHYQTKPKKAQPKRYEIRNDGQTSIYCWELVEVKTKLIRGKIKNLKENK